jgi:hypothetical protein
LSILNRNYLFNNVIKLAVRKEIFQNQNSRNKDYFKISAMICFIRLTLTFVIKPWVKKHIFLVLKYFIKVFFNLKVCIIILTPAKTSNIEVRAQTEAEK